MCGIWIYIYIQAGRHFFRHPRGLRPYQKPRKATHAPQRPRPGWSARARRRSLLDMDKTEASAARIQISRSETGKPHSFVRQMSHNKSWAKSFVNLSAYYGLALIYHKIRHLSSALPLQLDDNEPDQHSPGQGTVKAFYLTPKGNNACMVYICYPHNNRITNVCLYNNAIHGNVI